jgi:hypothetical protein
METGPDRCFPMVQGKSWASHGIPLGRTRLQPRVEVAPSARRGGAGRRGPPGSAPHASTPSNPRRSGGRRVPLRRAWKGAAFHVENEGASATTPGPPSIWKDEHQAAEAAGQLRLLDPAHTGSRDTPAGRGGFQPFLPHRVQPVPAGPQAGRTQDARAASSRQERGVAVSSDSSEPPTGSPRRLQGEPRPRTAHLAPEAGSG